MMINSQVKLFHDHFIASSQLVPTAFKLFNRGGQQFNMIQRLERYKISCISYFYAFMLILTSTLVEEIIHILTHVQKIFCAYIFMWHILKSKCFPTFAN